MAGAEENVPTTGVKEEKVPTTGVKEEKVPPIEVKEEKVPSIVAKEEKVPFIKVNEEEVTAIENQNISSTTKDPTTIVEMVMAPLDLSTPKLILPTVVKLNFTKSFDQKEEEVITTSPMDNTTENSESDTTTSSDPTTEPTSQTTTVKQIKGAKDLVIEKSSTSEGAITDMLTTESSTNHMLSTSATTSELTTQMPTTTRSTTIMPTTTQMPTTKMSTTTDSTTTESTTPKPTTTKKDEVSTEGSTKRDATIPVTSTTAAPSKVPDQTTTLFNKITSQANGTKGAITEKPPFNLGKTIEAGFQKGDPLVIGVTAGAGALVLIIIVIIIICVVRCKRKRRDMEPKLRTTHRHDIARQSIDDIFRDKGYSRLKVNHNESSNTPPGTMEMAPLLRDRSVMNRNVLNRDVLKTTGQTFLGNGGGSPPPVEEYITDTPVTTPNDIDSPQFDGDLTAKDLTLAIDPDLYDVNVPNNTDPINPYATAVINETIDPKQDTNPWGVNNNNPSLNYVAPEDPEETNPFIMVQAPGLTNPFRASKTVNDYQYE